MATAISRPRACARFLPLLCRRRRLSALPRRRRLRAKISQHFPPLCNFFNFHPSLSPFLPYIVFSRRGFSRPTLRHPVHLRSPGRIWCLLTGFSPSSRFPRRCCTVLYCTVLYASFDVMAVGTNSLTCGFNWQCTADVIGYAVMITARLDSLPSPQSLPRFRSTPAGRQPGQSREQGKVKLIYRRYFQHAHFIPIGGVGKRGAY